MSEGSVKEQSPEDTLAMWCDCRWAVHAHNITQGMFGGENTGQPVVLRAFGVG